MVVTGWAGVSGSKVSNLRRLRQEATVPVRHRVWDPRGLNAPPILCPEGNAVFSTPIRQLAGIAERYAAVQERYAACFAATATTRLRDRQVAGDLEDIRSAGGELESWALIRDGVGSVYAACSRRRRRPHGARGSLAQLRRSSRPAWGASRASRQQSTVVQRCAANRRWRVGDDTAPGSTPSSRSPRNPPLVPGNDNPDRGCSTGVPRRDLNLAGSTEIAEKASRVPRHR